MRSSNRLGVSSRRMSPAPSPPSESDVANIVRVAPTAMMPKSRGWSIRASATLPKKPTKRLTSPHEPAKKAPLDTRRLRTLRERWSLGVGGTDRVVAASPPSSSTWEEHPARR